MTGISNAQIQRFLAIAFGLESNFMLSSTWLDRKKDLDTASDQLMKDETNRIMTKIKATTEPREKYQDELEFLGNKKETFDRYKMAYPTELLLDATFSQQGFDSQDSITTAMTRAITIVGIRQFSCLLNKHIGTLLFDFNLRKKHQAKRKRCFLETDAMFIN